MINSTNIAEQTVATNGNILFANTQVRTCSANYCNGWLNDADSVEDKVYIYFSEVPKED